MNKKLTILGIVFVMLLGWLLAYKPPLFGGDPIQTEVDSVFSQIKTYESDEFSKNKDYTEFVWSGATPDRVTKKSWTKTAKPNDETIDWTSINNLPSSTLASYKVDIHTSSKGKGYVMTATYKDASGTHNYSESVGVENYPFKQKVWTTPLDNPFTHL